MKWGRKTSSPPSFGSSVITRVFPGSWFSKFKQTGGGSLDTTSGKKQRRGKLDFSTGNSALPKDGRFYSLDNDAYWTLSFRKDRGEGKRRNKSGRINPLWYESDDEYLVAVSNFKGSGLRKSQLPRRDLEGISELDTEEMKQEGCSNNILQENGASGKKKQNRRSRKLRSRVGRKKKKAEFRTGLDEGENESSNPEEEEQEVFLTKLQTIDEVNEESQDSSVTNSRNHQNTSCHSFSPSSDGEDYATSERISTLKCQNLENTRVEEYYEEAKYQEESAYISKRSRSKKIKKKARGSRSECRIQALADMKKARMKLKKEKKEEVIGSPTIYNSFAVMKSSFNPQQDFKDSMMEMIKEKGITHREELEELLACYLTLNSDEHHHLIINVFQQVWFELNRVIY